MLEFLKQVYPGWTSKIQPDIKPPAFIIATRFYSGGITAGCTFGWVRLENNYLSNLFPSKAVNGMDNPSRYCAAAGMIFLTASFAYFFIIFSDRIPGKAAPAIIKFCGAGAALFALLAITPFHDEALKMCSILILLALFYITVFLLKSRLHLLKIFSVLNLLLFYFCNFMYFARFHLEFLPIVQKILLLSNISLITLLYYFTSADDFKPIKIEAKG